MKQDLLANVFERLTPDACTCLLTFSRAGGRLHVSALHYDWFAWLLVSVVIGQSYF